MRDKAEFDRKLEETRIGYNNKLRQVRLDATHDVLEQGRRNIGMAEVVRLLPILNIDGDKPIDVQEWIDQIDEVIGSYHIDELTVMPGMRRVVTGSLKKWMEKFVNSNTTWQEMKEKLIADFVKPKSAIDIYEEVRAKIRRPGQNLESFYLEMEALAENVIPPPDLMWVIMKNSRYETLENEARSKRKPSREELWNRIHELTNESWNEGNNNKSGWKEEAKQSVTVTPSNATMSFRTIKCYNCNAHGHLSRDCHKTRSTTPEGRRRCFKCGEFGHIVRTCHMKEGRSWQQDEARPSALSAGGDDRTSFGTARVPRPLAGRADGSSEIYNVQRPSALSAGGMTAHMMICHGIRTE